MGAVYAGEDRKFHLDMYTRLLRKHGLRRDTDLEMYMKAAEKWRSWDRAAPIPVFQHNEVVVLRVAGLSNLKEWDEMEPFIF